MTSFILVCISNPNSLLVPILMNTELALVDRIALEAITGEQMVQEGGFEFVEFQFEKVEVCELGEGEVAVAVD